MKTGLIFLLLMVFSPLQVFSQSKITLKLQGIERTLYAVVPVNGKYVMHNNQPLDPHKRKSFSLALDEEESSFVYIFYDFQMIPIFLKSGMKSKVTLRSQQEYSFAGDYQQENSWINQWSRQFVSPYSSKVASLTDTIFQADPEKAFPRWKALLNENLVDLNSNCTSCDKEFKKMVKKDMAFFYANEFVRSVLRHTSRAVIWENPESYSEEDKQNYERFASFLAPAWDSIYQYVQIDHDALYSQEYLSFLRAYYDVYRLGFKKEHYDKYYNLERREKVMLQLAKEELSTPVYEALYAFNLEYMLGGGPSVNTPEFIDRYETFLKQFPESDFLLSLAPRMESVYEFVNRADERPTLSSILPTDQYLTVQKLLRKFKGKTVLMDLWATWCKPCLEEFTYADQLYSFTQNKSIVPLYISVDSSKDKEKWESFIGKYHLQGSHILASKELIQDIWKQIGDVGQQGYPRYIIADQEGNIVVKDAFRPSGGQKFYDQFSEP